VISSVISRIDPALIEIAGGAIFLGRQPVSLNLAHSITNPVLARAFRGLRTLASFADGSKVYDVGHSDHPT